MILIKVDRAVIELGEMRSIRPAGGESCPGFIVCSRGMGEKPSPLGEDFQYACGRGLSEVVS